MMPRSMATEAWAAKNGAYCTASSEKAVAWPSQVALMSCITPTRVPRRVVRGMVRMERVRYPDSSSKVRLKE